MGFLSNQDFVWGLGLIVSGVIIALTMRKIPYQVVRSDLAKSGSDWNVNVLWLFAMRWFIPLAGTMLIGWWFIQSITVFAPREWFNPLNPYSLATVLVQWGLGLTIVIVGNRFLIRKL